MFEHEELKEIEEYNKKYAVTRYGGVKRLLEYKYNEFESLLKFYSFKSLIDEINKRCSVNINYIHAKGEYNKIKKSMSESSEVKSVKNKIKTNETTILNNDNKTSNNDDSKSTIKHKSIFDNKLNEFSRELIEKYSLNDTELKVIGVGNYIDDMVVYDLIKNYCNQLEIEKSNKEFDDLMK